jgi:RNA polymerase sigma factor (sigma-70 family)
MKVFETSTSVREILLQIRQGEQTAVGRLFDHVMDRLRILSHKLFLARKDLHHFGDGDDLLQDSLIRLHRAVLELKPDTTRAFMALALQHVRWALRDLARDMQRDKQKFPRGDIGSKIPALHTLKGEPESLLEWQFFHSIVEKLPSEEREVFDAIYYGGANQEEVAQRLQVSTRTIKRRWRNARSMLGREMGGEWPPLG